MEIINKTSKILFIGSITLYPGKNDINVKTSVKNKMNLRNPSFKEYQEDGLIEVVKEDVKKGKKPKDNINNVVDDSLTKVQIIDYIKYHNLEDTLKLEKSLELTKKQDLIDAVNSASKDENVSNGLSFGD